MSAVVRIKSTKFKWPKEVELATPDTVCTNFLFRGRRACAIGHFLRAVGVGGKPYMIPRKMLAQYEKAYNRACRELHGIPTGKTELSGISTTTR